MVASSNIQASMDFKYLNDRYQRGKEAIDRMMNEKHILMRASSLNLAHASVLQAQAAMGPAGSLPRIWNCMLYNCCFSKTSLNCCFFSGFRLLTYTGWPSWLGMLLCGLPEPRQNHTTSMIVWMWFPKIFSSIKPKSSFWMQPPSFKNIIHPGPILIDEAVALAQGISMGNQGTVSFWCLPQWHSSSHKNAVLNNRRLLEDKVVAYFAYNINQFLQIFLSKAFIAFSLTTCWVLQCLFLKVIANHPPEVVRHVRNCPQLRRLRPPGWQA